MRAAILYLAVFLGMSAGAQERAGDRWFRTVTADDGLPNDIVNCVTRDDAGFTWVGTADGLARFDGREFTRWFHDPTDSTSLPRNTVGSVLATTEGIWVGTEGGGAALLDPRSDHFQRIHIDAAGREQNHADQIRQFVRTLDGGILIGTATGLAFLPPGGTTATWIDADLPKEDRKRQYRRCDMMWDDQRHGVWVASTKGLLFLDPATRHWSHAKDPGSFPPGTFSGGCRGAAVDRAGTIWSRSTNAELELLRAHPDDGHIEHFDLRAMTGGWFDAGTVQAFAMDRDDRIWLTTWSGKPIVFDTRTLTVDTTLMRARAGAPATNVVHDAHVDAEGRCWLATAAGLSFELRGTYPFRLLFTHDDLGIPANMIGSVLPDRDGSLWIGSRAGVFHARPAEAPQRVKLIGADAVIAEDVNALFPRDSTSVWIAGYQGCWSLEKATGRIARPTGLRPEFEAALFDGPKVQDVHHDAQGGLWIATWNRGLFHVMPNGESERFTNDAGAMRGMGSMVMSIQDGPGGTWFTCNSTGGVWRYDHEHARMEQVLRVGTAPGDLPEGAVTDIGFLPNGSMMLATFGGGFIVRDPAGHLRTYSRMDGLLSEYVHRIIPIPGGDVLLTGPQGITRWQPGTGRFTVFQDLFTLPGVEVQRSGELTDDGRLIGYDDRSIYAFSLERRTDLPRPPRPYLTSVRVFDRPLLFNGHSFALTHDQNFLDFRWSAIDPEQERIAFEYRMDGVDADWVKAGDRQFATYTSVPDGDHRFHLRSISEQGEVSATEAGFTFSILPPFWKTWWFIALSIVTLGAIGYFAATYRLKQRLKVQTLRNDIARDLHDDVGSVLSSITIYSDLAQRMTPPEHHQAHELLERIGTGSRTMMTNMRDIVWAIQPRFDKGEDLVLHLKDHASELLGAKGITVQFRIMGADRLTLNMIARRNIFMIYKEALNNLIKYSSAANASITIDGEGARFRMVVADNGVGFTPGNTSGNGLHTMLQRAEELSGTLTVESAPGKGTTVTLNCPTPKIRD